MKFKEIKPGMVIHCPKEEDARALLEHLEKLGFLINEKDITHPEFEWSWNVSDGVCYTIDSENSWSWGRCGKSAENDGLIYTEFSDLIEPDDSPVNSDTDSPMSAVEVLEWLRNNEYTGAFGDVFGDEELDIRYVVEEIDAKKIVERITAYEAAKKAPKPVEVEWVDICRIIQIQDNGFKKCVYEEELPDNNGYATSENILKKYISEHKGQYIAVIEGICRVKDGES